jgi:CRP/FNR family transcriptional regulator
LEISFESSAESAVEQNVVEILMGCRLFSKVQERGFQRLVAMARLCRFDKADTVFREGQECPGVYVVGSGLIRVFKTAASGKEHVLHMVGPGRTFAEVAAIGGFNCPAHAEAVVPSLCALLPLAPFKRALDEDHDLCTGMMIGLAVWAHQLVELLEDVVLRDAIGRLARYLLAAPAGDDVVELPALKRHVASHLNLTSETLSRTIRRLVEAGLIEPMDGGRVRLMNRPRLQRVAEGMVSDI